MKTFKNTQDLQADMDPSRNMARYRSLLVNKSSLFPAVRAFVETLKLELYRN